MKKVSEALEEHGDPSTSRDPRDVGEAKRRRTGSVQTTQRMHVRTGVRAGGKEGDSP
jgi:hypothetical protein